MFVESLEPSILRELLGDATIAAARVGAPKRISNVQGRRTPVGDGSGDDEDADSEDNFIVTATSALGLDDNLASILEVGRCVDAVADGAAQVVPGPATTSCRDGARRVVNATDDLDASVAAGGRSETPTYAFEVDADLVEAVKKGAVEKGTTTTPLCA
jgi:hypothetical protein